MPRKVSSLLIRGGSEGSEAERTVTAAKKMWLTIVPTGLPDSQARCEVQVQNLRAQMAFVSEVTQRVDFPTTVAFPQQRCGCD